MPPPPAQVGDIPADPPPSRVFFHTGTLDDRAKIYVFDRISLSRPRRTTATAATRRTRHRVDARELASDSRPTDYHHTQAARAAQSERVGPRQSRLVDILRESTGRENLSQEEAERELRSLLKRGRGDNETAAMTTPAAEGPPIARAAPVPVASRAPTAGLTRTTPGDGQHYARDDEINVEDEAPYGDAMRSTSERRRAIGMALPNARGVSRPAAVGWGGIGGGAPPPQQSAPPANVYRSLYGAPQHGITPQRVPPQSLLGTSAPGSGLRGPIGYGANRGAGYGTRVRSPPTASGAGMDFDYQGPGLGMLSAGSKRGRDAAEFEAHERDIGRATVPRLTPPPERGNMPPPPPVHAMAAPSNTPVPLSARATPGATSAVTTDTARRILQTLDRLAGQKGDASGVAASPLPKPLNLSSSLNRAAAPTSSLHGFRGIQRATPSKAFADAEKRLPSTIASHSKPALGAIIASAGPTAATPLQFTPNVLSKEKTTVAVAPPVQPIEIKSQVHSIMASAVSTIDDGPGAEPELPPPSIPTKSAAPSTTPLFDGGAPTFSFRDPPPQSKGEAINVDASATIAGELPKYTFGGDDSDEMELPTFIFGDEDDGDFEVSKFGSDDLNQVADITYTFGEGAPAPDTAMKAAKPATLFTSESPKPKAPVETKPVEASGSAVDDKPVEAPKKTGSLWGADFMKKNLEHQKKVQAAIDEEENKAKNPAAATTAAPAAPSPFVTASSTGDAPAPAFSFGVGGASTAATTTTASAPSTGGFTFGAPPPAAVDASESKPAAAAAAFTFGASSTPAVAIEKSADVPPPSFGFGAPAAVPPAVEESKPASAPAPPAFTFGASSTPATEAPKPAAVVEPPSLFTATPAPSTSPPLSAKAPPFTFGAGSTPAPSSVAAEPVAAEKPKSETLPSGGFTFGGASTGAAPAPGASGFGMPATSAATAPEPFKFGGSTGASAPSSGAAFGAPSSGAAFGAPSSGAAFSAPSSGAAFAFGAPSSGATFGAPPAVVSEPAPVSSTPFKFGAEPSAAPSASAPAPTPVFGAVSTTPAFGGAPSTAAAPTFAGFGTSAAPAPSGAGDAAFTFGSSGNAASTPAPAAPALTPFGSAASMPVAGGFGAAAVPSSNPFGSSGNLSAAAPSGSAPAASNPFTFGAPSGGGGGGFGGGSGFGGGTGAPPPVNAPSMFGGAGASPAPGGGGGFGSSSFGSGGTVPPPAFGSGGGALTGGGSVPPPAFGGAGATGGFGGGAGPPGMPMGGGGMSMGAGDAPSGGRKTVKKARRPPRRGGGGGGN